MKEKRIAAFLMIVLVVIWGFNYIVAKQALRTFSPIVLLFFKYVIAFVVVFGIKQKMDRKAPLFRKKDIVLFLLCSVVGEVIYYCFEYTAITMMDVSLVTIVLGIIPALSIITERIIYKRRVTNVMVIGIAACLVGIALVIGVDFRALVHGQAAGYLLAFGAVFAWNIYNFLTAALHKRAYSSVTLTCTQLICAVLMLAPYALAHFPPAGDFTPGMVGNLIYLGAVDTGIGYIIMIRTLHILGPTPTALYSNFLPVTTAFFGWLILKETISVVQVIGGVIVIGAAFVVIREKGRVEERIQRTEEQIQ